MTDPKPPKPRAKRESVSAHRERLRLLKDARIRQEFRTLKYPNSGAYSSIPTIAGNLPERPPELVPSLVKVYDAAKNLASFSQSLQLREALNEVEEIEEKAK